MQRRIPPFFPELQGNDIKRETICYQNDITYTVSCIKQSRFDTERQVLTMAKTRSALLVRCTPEEAEAIRRAARRERRSISGFILNAVMSRMVRKATIQERLAKSSAWGRSKEQ